MMGSRGYDVAVVGGGIIGLATARALTERHRPPGVIVVEKESEIARHQTGHNSGVIHSGIYYRPGSLKARLCVEGASLLARYCQAHGLPWERCGKVIVATHERELPRLAALYERGVANGVPGIAIIEPAGLKEIEPHAAGIRALHSPETAIVDYRAVARAMAADLEGQGGEILTGARVAGVVRSAGMLRLQTTRGDVAAKRLINCAGLHSDAVARMAGARPDLRIIPFRGEYYTLRADRRPLVRGMIYPVPDPDFPFLGVHFTRTIHGEVEAGPNAILALAREGYTMGAINLAETLGTLTYRGFWTMAGRYWKTGLYELYRSISKGAFVEALRRLVPELEAGDVVPGGAGVRAQAVRPDGTFVDDFAIIQTADAIHVLNAPSPAATASLAIGRHVADLAAASFHLSG